MAAGVPLSDMCASDCEELLQVIVQCARQMSRELPHQNTRRRRMTALLQECFRVQQYQRFLAQNQSKPFQTLAMRYHDFLAYIDSRKNLWEPATIFFTSAHGRHLPDLSIFQKDRSMTTHVAIEVLRCNLRVRFHQAMRQQYVLSACVAHVSMSQGVPYLSITDEDLLLQSIGKATVRHHMIWLLRLTDLDRPIPRGDVSQLGSIFFIADFQNSSSQHAIVPDNASILYGLGEDMSLQCVCIIAESRDDFFAVYDCMRSDHIIGEAIPIRTFLGLETPDAADRLDATTSHATPLPSTVISEHIASMVSRGGICVVDCIAGADVARLIQMSIKGLPIGDHDHIYICCHFRSQVADIYEQLQETFPGRVGQLTDVDNRPVMPFHHLESFLEKLWQKDAGHYDDELRKYDDLIRVTESMCYHAKRTYDASALDDQLKQLKALHERRNKYIWEEIYADRMKFREKCLSKIDIWCCSIKVLHSILSQKQGGCNVAEAKTCRLVFVVGAQHEQILSLSHFYCMRERLSYSVMGSKCHSQKNHARVRMTMRSAGLSADAFQYYH